MLVLLSPAKRLEEVRDAPPIEVTTPRFAGEARVIGRVARRLGADGLAQLMGISPTLATLNAARFDAFGRGATRRPAIFTFAGDVYRGFDAWSLAPDALAYAQSHVRLLSGLYGWLRPFDAIEPYRLEMGVGLAVGRAASLVDYWAPKLARAARDELAAAGGPIVNLASIEYFAPLSRARLGVPVIEARFETAGANGARRFDSFAAKHARGAMARWICERGVERAGDLEDFDGDGYAFDRAGSTAERLLFVKAAQAA